VLSSPLGGETWEVNTPHAVTWTASDNAQVDSVNVDWSAHGNDGPWLPVAHALANTGSFSWLVPGSPTDSALVRVTAFDQAGNSAQATSPERFAIAGTVGVGDHVPALLALARPMPNPARGTTTLRFSLPSAGIARLEVLDVTGRRVWSRSESLAPGPHAAAWDGRDDEGHLLGTGLYLVRLVTPWGNRGTRLAWVR
jgi:hypothetical protein